MRPVRNFLSLAAAREVLECRRRKRRRRRGKGLERRGGGFARYCLRDPARSALIIKRETEALITFLIVVFKHMTVSCDTTLERYVERTFDLLEFQEVEMVCSKEKLVWRLRNMTVELQLLKPPSSCMITGGAGEDISNGGFLSTLINPANRSLSGTSLPYFPRGGPVPRPPPPGLSNSLQGWGGMEAGPNMLYPSQVCDGVVHSLGGPTLAKLLEKVSHMDVVTTAPGSLVSYSYGENPDAKELCPIGSSVITPTAKLGQLPSTGYKLIAHTAPPIFPVTETDLVPEWKSLLASCYTSSLLAISNHCTKSPDSKLAVASPVLGSGAR